MKFKEYKGLDLAQTAADVLGEWDARDTFHKSITTREGHPDVRILRRPPVGQRHAGHPPRHGPYDQGRFLPLQNAAGLPRAPQGGLGYARTARSNWASRRSSASPRRTSARKITDRRVQPHLPRSRDGAIPGMWERPDPQDGLLGQHGRSRTSPTTTNTSRRCGGSSSELFDKGLLYKGYTIQPYSPAAGTGLSTHELNQPGCYRDVKDTTCTAQFEVIRDQKSEKLFAGVEGPLYFLAWTTTPWTLPSNTALAVGPAIRIRQGQMPFNPYTGRPHTVILAKELVPAYFHRRRTEGYRWTVTAAAKTFRAG